jgi:hypothetical protein
LDSELAMNQAPGSQDPLRFFTFAGRLLFLVTLVVGGGLFAWVVLYGKDRVPTGSYPVAFILIPVVIGAAIFFLIAQMVLRLFGIRVWAEDNGADAKQGAPPNDGPGASLGDPRRGQGSPSVT